MTSSFTCIKRQARISRFLYEQCLFVTMMSLKTQDLYIVDCCFALQIIFCEHDFTPFPLSSHDVILLSVALLAEWNYNAFVRFVELKLFVLPHQPGNCYFVSYSLSLVDIVQQILSPFLTCSLIRNVAGNLVCPSFILWCCVIIATTNILLSDLHKTIKCDKILELLD